MTKTGKVLTGIGGVILLLLVVAIVFIMTFDWNRLKPTINDKVSAELQRPFAIRGNLGVDWSRKGDEPGWRGWVPWPHIHAEDLVLGNPSEWVSDKAASDKPTDDKNVDDKTASTAFPAGEMVTLKRVDASIAPLALLAKEVWIPRIWLTQPDANLRRLANGNNNWTFNLANSQKEGE
ncbi:protein YhjG [Yersinia mollaretii]|nr:protein YhjG [Yersinia mollaretii]